MKLIDVAKQYCSIAIYKKDTADTIIRIARLFEERSGIETIKDINYESIGCWRECLLSKICVKPVTYNGYLGYLRLLSRYMFEEGLIEKDFFQRVKSIPAPKSKPKSLEPEVVFSAISYLKANSRPEPAWFWVIVIRFLYYTGLRRRQLISLEWQDIDLKNRVMSCSYRGSKTSREWDIPIADNIIDDLIYLIDRNEDALGRAMSPTDRIFNVCRFNKRYYPDPAHSGAMRANHITQFFKRLSRDLGVRIGAHKLRHTFATELCNPEDEAEADLFAIQTLLGHTMLSTTRIYVKTKIKRARNVVNGLKEPSY